MGFDPAKMICIGRIVSAHGIKGQVKVKIFTTSQDTFKNYTNLMDDKGQTFDIIHGRTVDPLHLLVTVGHIRDRTQAELLRGKDLYIRRDQLPEAGEDEFYHSDLIGMDVKTTDGVILGVVQDVHNFGAGDMIGVLQKGAPALMIPFTKAAVVDVNLVERYLVVDGAIYQDLIKDEPGP